MSAHQSRYRWFVVFVFFGFMLLHQMDKLLIGPLTPKIIEEFNITYTQMGAVTTGALIVGTFLYPLWGYLYDRFSRAKLLALASLLWGATTWLSAVVRTYPGFLVTRASTGIDDSSYPGLYSLVADYFGPELRGKIFGLLQVSGPIGYLLGMVLALMVAPALAWGWRGVFYLTGVLGILLAIVIYFGVREMPRGQSEPEFAEAQEMQKFEFNWQSVRDILKRRTMWFVFMQGFAGVFPWNVITYWFFTYLGSERGYNEDAILFTMAPVILVLAAGYFVGGAAGDWLFKRTTRGRIIVSSIGVLMGALFLFLAIRTPIEETNTFLILMMLTALFMPFSAPNVISTVYDVVLPEVRATANSAQYFIENFGAAAAPLMAGIIADQTGSLATAILFICTIAWLACFVIYLGALFFIDKDHRHLRETMSRRAAAG
jgi:MFS transporter, Spinster family, sphingosine-1-phosphate transporter